MNLLLIGGCLSNNEGGVAIVRSVSQCLSETLPDVTIRLTSWLPSADSKRSLVYGIDIVVERQDKESTIHYFFSWLGRVIKCSIWKITKDRKIIGVVARILEQDNIIRAYLEQDLILEISGDGLSGDYGWLSTAISLSRLACALLLKKRVVIYAQSLGPFLIKWPMIAKPSSLLSQVFRKAATKLFNKVNLITVREEISFNFIKKIGVKNANVYLTADSAFLLRPATPHVVDNILSKYEFKHESSYIGVSISNSISFLKYSAEKSVSSKDKYFSNMALILDYFIDKYKLCVIMVPHVIGPGYQNDDWIGSKHVYDLMKNKSEVILLDRGYLPEELKGIIGRCQLFIGSRMHASIAALSMGIPTVAIGYSPKTLGIMTMAGQKDYVCDFTKLSYQELLATVEQAWIKRKVIAESLKIVIPEIEKRSLENVYLVKELLYGKVGQYVKE
jgi:colanic acid/amylovoran biosynthesis protein